MGGKRTSLFSDEGRGPGRRQPEISMHLALTGSWIGDRGFSGIPAFAGMTEKSDPNICERPEWVESRYALRVANRFA
jgi:hypothetical protein